VTPAARQLAALPLARCVWPHGEPEDGAFRWCGERVEPGRPYCADHAEQAIERELGKREAA